jgi:hypothetical protein
MRLGLLLVATAQLVVVPMAPAHAGAPAWPVGKAERLVERDAVVLMPAQQRTALRAELLELIPRFRILENTAWDLGDHQASSRAHNYRYRYSTALKLVEGGLGVVEATCRGVGVASGSRFAHFECSAVSERLEIPSVDVVYGDENAVPALVEREPRLYGPYQARLVVHTTRRSSIAYRQGGEATSR